MSIRHVFSALQRLTQELLFILLYRSDLHTGVVITSYEPSRPKPNAEGEASVDLGESASQGNRTQVNSLLCSHSLLPRVKVATVFKYPCVIHNYF